MLYNDITNDNIIIDNYCVCGSCISCKKRIKIDNNNKKWYTHQKNVQIMIYGIMFAISVFIKNIIFDIAFSNKTDIIHDL